ncbi:MAG: hypothetical protein Q8L27_02090 [archaeon]|nr:hypothetical protein [archaeon]
MTSLSLSLSPGQSLKQTIRLILPVSFLGELELLSLHKIKNRIHGMKVHSSTNIKLSKELIKENREYQRLNKNRRYCITPNNLDNAIDATREYLVQQMNLGLSTVEDLNLRNNFERVMQNQIQGQNKIIRTWFADNYDQILYEQECKIPFPIVRQMRAKFAQWAIGITNPFCEPIEDLMDETAKSLGINSSSYESPEELWEALKDYK